MFNSNDAGRLADLSRLRFSDKEFERMTQELERAIHRAKKVFENEGVKPQSNSTNVSMLREDSIEAFEDIKSLSQNGETKNNLFVSKRVV